jgi:Transposase
VAWPRRGRPEGGRSALRLLGKGHAPAGGQARPHHLGALQQVRDLRARNVGLLECARRLNLSLNTVKRYDRASEPERLQRVPKYRPTLVDPHRDYLRKRRAEEPGVPVRQLLREIRERGYRGSSNLLVRYISQGRAEGDRPHLSPRRATRILLTRPDRLTGGQHETLAGLTAACPEMTALAGLITSFAALLVPDPGNDARLRQWITDARAADLPHVHSFSRGLGLDIRAVTAALTMPHHNGRTEGVNTKTKMIKRQCTDERASPCCAIAFSSDDATHRHHRKCDRAKLTVGAVRRCHSSGGERPSPPSCRSRAVKLGAA